MEEKLVSVIIPTYNRASFIKETLRSVLAQTYQNFEIIIVDDGSTDDTKDVVKSIDDDRINYIYQNNSGQPANPRNNGIKHSNGKYIAFLDSDDLWIPEKLEIQLDYFEKDSNLLLISSDAIKFPGIEEKMQNSKNNKLLTFKELIKQNLVFTSSVIMLKEVVDKVGVFDEDSRLRAVEDFDYWLRISKIRDNCVMVLKNCLFKYRLSEDSISDVSAADYLVNIHNKFLVIAEKHNDIDKNFKKQVIKDRKSRAINYKMKYLLKIKQISFLDYLKAKDIKFTDKIRGTIGIILGKTL
jgi:glycosyltransferase involved in cell wall biosynthesis